MFEPLWPLLHFVCLSLWGEGGGVKKECQGGQKEVWGALGQKHFKSRGGQKEVWGGQKKAGGVKKKLGPLKKNRGLRILSLLIGCFLQESSKNKGKRQPNSTS